MPDYKKMYLILFNKITDIVYELQAVQQQTEELYISDKEQVMELNVFKKEKEDSVSTTPQK